MPGSEFSAEQRFVLSRVDTLHRQTPLAAPPSEAEWMGKALDRARFSVWLDAKQLGVQAEADRIIRDTTRLTPGVERR